MTNHHSSNRKRRRTGADLLEALLQEAKPSFHAWHVAEPQLLFAGRQTCEDPKTGLTLFGPAGLDRTPRPSIRLGVVGTGDSIQALKNWIEAARAPIRAGCTSAGKPFDTLLAPTFPGFDTDSPIRCAIEIADNHCETLTKAAVESALNDPRFARRVDNMVRLLTDKLKVLGNKEPQPDVVVCAMPKEVESACGPEARAEGRTKVFLTPAQRKERKRLEKDRKRGQLVMDFVYDNDPPEDPSLSRFNQDFHNALKAQAMATGLPTQLVWDSTLRRTRGTQDPATVAWNFFTAVYYKAGNVPWELSFPTSGSCFVGVSFYRESPDPEAATRTCLAQAFSETGEGIVLRGDPVTWDKERDRKPHLSREASKKLLERVLDVYKSHFSTPPRRVVVHKTSRYWDDERDGFLEAITQAGVPSYDLLALERRGIRFFRLGAEPPVRGTVVQLGQRNYLVFTRGYVPFLRAYPGLRVPNPLEVVEHIGDSSADRVCSELLALTKLNWNTSAFASADPITIAFAQEVAKIIKELPDGRQPHFKYRYYM
jgi:hypothetical protein